MMCSLSVFAEVLKGGIEYQVPTDFFGTWRVTSIRVETNSPQNFRQKNTDIWNLSKQGDVITLTNPFSKATASVNIDYANKNVVKFSTEGNYDNKVLTDTVELTLSEDKFIGVDTITLETLSNVDNSVIKTVSATYKLTGEKIAGMSIGE